MAKVSIKSEKIKLLHRKIKKETNRFFDLSLSVPEAGLEPAQPQWPKDFKSFVSTIPPSGLNS